MIRTDYLDTTYETVKKFKKKFPNFKELKEGKYSIFIDARLLDKLDTIPEKVKLKVLAHTRISRFSRTDFCVPAKDEETGIFYSFDIDCCCYDFFKNDKLVYAVLKIDGVRWREYEPNIYGNYSEKPVNSGSLHWSELLNFRRTSVNIIEGGTEKWV